MKFGLVNKVKVEARKGLVGYCPFCGSELIAKCGAFKIHHWAHKSIKKCDHWWEPETEWHRNWKNNYPNEWQEVQFVDPISKEKHIADVSTIHELVVEFQHSPLDLKERQSREAFYNKMVWVVNGTRLNRDYARFQKASDNFLKTEKEGIYWIDNYDQIFPPNWGNCAIPVIFDFRGNEILKTNSDKANSLFCLFFIPNDRYSILAEISKDLFIDLTLNGKWTEWVTLLTYYFHPRRDRTKEERPQLSQKPSTHILDPKKGRFFKRRRF